MSFRKLNPLLALFLLLSLLTLATAQIVPPTSVNGCVVRPLFPHFTSSNPTPGRRSRLLQQASLAPGQPRPALHVRVRHAVEHRNGHDALEMLLSAQGPAAEVVDVLLSAGGVVSEGSGYDEGDLV